MTMVVPQTYGGPPQYPTSQMVPREFWRKSSDAIDMNPQCITIETPTGPQKRAVTPGWDNPVTFTSD